MSTNETSNNTIMFDECHACHPLALRRRVAYHGCDSNTKNCIGCALDEAANFEISCKKGCKNKEYRNTMNLTTKEMVNLLTQLRDIKNSIKRPTSKD